MIIVCTRDARVRNWALDPNSGAGPWGKVELLSEHASQLEASTQLQNLIRDLDPAEPVCLSAHGNNTSIGDEVGGWTWTVPQLANLLADVPTRTGPLLISACGEGSPAGIQSALALALEGLKKQKGLWIYTYVDAVPIRVKFPNPHTMDNEGDLTFAQVWFTGTSLSPNLDQHELALAIQGARDYVSSLNLSGEYDPHISDSDGLVTYINATTNPPPPELVEERDKVSAILEGLTGIVVAAVLQTAGDDQEKRHQPASWTNPMIYGLTPFMGGYSQETTTYDREFAGLELSVQFLNILMETVTNAGGALGSFKDFLEKQGDAIKLNGEHTQEGYKFATVGIVHDIFMVDGRWTYLPKIRAYFTSFTRETFKVTSACASAEHIKFHFTMEKTVMPFKIQTWRDSDTFKAQVQKFIDDFTKAQIDQSASYFKGIFSANPA
jgi:virulence factor Evf-like protein